MKYRYTIFAESDYEENEIIAKLEKMGLQEIFVEKYVNIDEIIADQNNFADENFDANLERIIESDIIPVEMAHRLLAYFADENEKTMRRLFEAIQKIGVEMDVPNGRIAKIISKANQILN